MSVARGYGMNGRGYYTNVAKPIDCNLNFIVDSTNGNGLGIRSLKSNGFVQNVFMHTSSTPGNGTGGFLNPNPLAGFALIQFKNNFNYYLGGFSGFVSPTVSATTSTTSGLTVGQAYIITVLGTTTLAEWQTIGLTAGLTPAVGQAFIAIATGTGGSHTGKVGLPGVSAISSIEVVGDTTQSLNNASIASNAGARAIVQFLAPTIASVGTTPAVTNAFFSPFIPTAPANGSAVGMCFRFDGSSVTVDGI